MLDDMQAEALKGAAVLDLNEEEVGTIYEIFTDAAEERPALASVDIGERRVLVPLDEADIEDDHLIVRYDADQIHEAPEAPEEHISPDETEAAYEHYGLSDAHMRDSHGRPVDSEGEPQGEIEDVEED
jgi:hypothetical protein